MRYKVEFRNLEIRDPFQLMKNSDPTSLQRILGNVQVCNWDINRELSMVQKRNEKGTCITKV